MHQTQRRGKKDRKAKEAATAPSPESWARGERRKEIQRALLETMQGLLSGRIGTKEAWAIGRRAQAELQLLGVMERLERMMPQEKTEPKRASAQGPKRARGAGSKGRPGGSGWVN